MNGDPLKKFNNKKGISLIEMIIALTVGSIIIATVSNNLPRLRKAANIYINQVNFEEDLRIFLILFEENFRSAEILNQNDKLNTNKLVFRQDYNLDGDYKDKAETISYRWNTAKFRIDRKSGKGNFQSILEGISSMSWNKISEMPFCFELIISEYFRTHPQKHLFCR